MSIYSIYKATNKINGKCYIGFDSCWPNRQTNHRHKYKKTVTKFYSAIKKYGWDNFEWEILYQSKDVKYCLNVMENHFINEYNSIQNGYNMTLGGEGVMIGRKHNHKSRQKMSKSHLGKKPSEKHLTTQREKINEYFNKNGSRIEKECLVCKKVFSTKRWLNRITCGRSCAATYRNLNRNK